jgi:lipid-A-disaccharide synthase
MGNYILIVAGDPSGDRHGALLVEELRRREPGLTFRGYGGPCLAQADVEVLADTTRFTAIGLLDALPHILPAFRAKWWLEDYARRDPPRLAILIDFGAFNLRFAPTLRQIGVPVLYYFPPGSWSGSRKRAVDVARGATKIATPFPQALPAYAELGADAVCVGHPLVDVLAPWADEPQAPAKEPLIALLPGSRRTEIRLLLPVLLQAAARIAAEVPSARFRLSRAATVKAEVGSEAIRQLGNSATRQFGPVADCPVAQLPNCPVAQLPTRPLFEKILRQHLAAVDAPVEVVDGSAAALRGATLALATSGTVTLEAALLGIPLVVVYRVTLLNYLIYLLTYFPKVRMFAMPNILAGRQIVPELRQYQVHPEQIAKEALALLRDDARRAAMSADLRTATQKLGEPGAIARAAEVALEMLAR